MNHQPDRPPSYRWLQILIAFAVFANFAPFFVTIIGPDGALYATISKTMAQRNDYVNLIAEGRDWLDKPHFPFWITAFSFEIFGVHGWSYKLPGLLFLMMGAWYTYLFGKKLYSKQTGLLAALILLSAEHILLSSNDVRAEPYLTGLIIAAVYHFVCLQNRYLLRDLLLGSLFAACAVMTKGIFALLPISGAVIGHAIITRQRKQLLQWRWLFAVILTLLFITPELYCLWFQFDIHPEKSVFGKTGVSGLKFFFWDSQFGRFFNTGPIKGKGDLSFFIHTTLWAFLPWSVLFFIAIGQRFGKFKKVGLEWYSFFAAMLTFLLFSLSSFQLPHYLNIVFPFFAVMTADYLVRPQLINTLQKIFRLQIVTIILLFAAAFALQIFYEPASWGWLVLAAGVLVVIILMPRNSQLLNRRIITLSASGIVIINLYLFWIIYPDLLTYQSGSQAAFIANKKYPGIPVVQYRHKYSYPLEFYLDAPLVTVDTLVQVSHVAAIDHSDAGQLLPGETASRNFRQGMAPKLPENQHRPYLLFTPEITDTTLTRPGQILPNFRISRLNAKFVNQKRRLSQVQWFKLELIR